MNQEQTVYVVDDDPAVCHALGIFLESEGYSVRMLASAEAMLKAINDDAPQGVLVLDQCMNGMSGLELQTELAAQGIEWPIVFISGHGNVGISVRAMLAGAVDFLEKPFRNKNLLESIRNAFLISEEAKQDHIRRTAVEAQCETLTAREREVMQLVVSGLRNKDIAQRMEIGSRKHGINTGDQVMNNTDPSRKRKIDDKLQYEPSMAIIGLLPVAVGAWVLTLLYYFILP